MNPTRKRRLWLVLAVLAAAVTAIALVTLARKAVERLTLQR